MAHARNPRPSKPPANAVGPPCPDPVELEAAWRELRRQQELLQLERQEQRRDHAEAMERWKARWASEWAQIHTETNRLAGEKKTLAEQRQQWNGTFETERRQLAAAWGQLRAEQRAWREHIDQKAAELDAQRRELDAERLRMADVREQFGRHREQLDILRHAQVQELDRLETRIAHLRRTLDSLREEIAERELALCGATDTAGRAARQRTEAPARQPESRGADAAPLAESEVLLARLAERLLDQARLLGEQRGGLLALRDEWRAEWDRALHQLVLQHDEVQRRADALPPQERALVVAEQALQRRAAPLHREEQRLQCWEAQLSREQGSLHFQRQRLIALVKARAAATRERHAWVVRLRRRWEREQKLERARCQQQHEMAREDYLTARDALRQRQTALDERERRLLQRDLVVTDVELKLLAQDPDPVVAEQELKRRQAEWEALAHAPLRAAARQKEELDRRAAQVDALHTHVRQKQQQLEDQRAELGCLAAAVEMERSIMAANRGRWEQERHALRTERAGLLQRVGDLNEQLERLTASLLGTQPDPPLALVA